MREEEPLGTADFAHWWRETGERELRELLYWKWDPIGVNDSFPAATDEYNQYAPRIVEALRRGATGAEIAGMLTNLEQDQMGLGGNATDRLQPLATWIIRWFQQSQEHWRQLKSVRR